jgi:hypothetical protein
MNQRVAWLATVGMLMVAGCTWNVPFDPAGFFGSLGDTLANLGEELTSALDDPLGSKPFPVLIGGDSERIFYATNLGDTRINFPGPTNDLVIPGFFGPSNLYKYEAGQSTLVRPLIPSGVFSAVATDGEYLVYGVSGEEGVLLPNQLVADRLDVAEQRVLFDASAVGSDAYVGSPIVDGGRVAFMVGDGAATPGAWLRIEDLEGAQAGREIETGFRFVFDLRGNLFVYELYHDELSELILLDLTTDETLTLAGDLPSGTFIGNVFFTNNRVVWSERGEDGVTRIVAYELASGATSVWADAVSGRLTGATDDHFLTEEYRLGSNNITERIYIRLHEVGGRVRNLADFRADGLAGQSRILGDRVVFVNAQRRIVIVPIYAGERTSFKPF